jgi:hypothetical protein
LKIFPQKNHFCKSQIHHLVHVHLCNQPLLHFSVKWAEDPFLKFRPGCHLFRFQDARTLHRNSSTKKFVKGKKNVLNYFFTRGPHCLRRSLFSSHWFKSAIYCLLWIISTHHSALSHFVNLLFRQCSVSSIHTKLFYMKVQAPCRLGIWLSIRMGWGILRDLEYGYGKWRLNKCFSKFC